MSPQRAYLFSYLGWNLRFFMQKVLGATWTPKFYLGTGGVAQTKQYT
jgi:hypothetical protein